MLACPECATARVVRTAVWDGDFWLTLLQLASPLLVLAGVATLLRGIGAAPSDPTTGTRGPEA